MGLLDDAIREHLELKLAHGADAGEVARQEQEALGPVRREPAAAEAEDLPAVDAAAPTELHGLGETGPDGGEPTVADLRDPVETETETETAAVDDVRPAAAEPAETEEWGFDDEDEGDPGDPEEADAAGEDVLEQTPEFLSETPEHDRLWFEQKPPRPFDFDS